MLWMQPMLVSGSLLHTEMKAIERDLCRRRSRFVSTWERYLVRHVPASCGHFAEIHNVTQDRRLLLRKRHQFTL